MLNHGYLLAKIGVDAAENEPLKVWRRFNLFFLFASLQAIFDAETLLRYAPAVNTLHQFLDKFHDRSRLIVFKEIKVTHR